jgi:hypothetical protein
MIPTRSFIRCAFMLGMWAPSCGPAHKLTAPTSTTGASKLNTTAQQPAATPQPSESSRSDIETGEDEEPQSVLEAGASLPPIAAEAPPPGAESIDSFMMEHFMISTWVRDSIADGNLEVIRAPLMELANYRYDTVAPGGWMKGIAQLQAAARLTAQAQTLPAAATGIATMGRLCGQCHREHGGPKVPRQTPDTSTPSSDRLSGRMLRHTWAMARLWEGLIAPSDDAWRAGADALAHAPIAAPETAQRLPQAFVNIFGVVRQLGVKASRAEADEPRAAVFAELLFTCSQCHRQQPRVGFAF